MAIAQIPQKAALTAREAAQEWKDRAGSLRGNEKKMFTRSLVVGSLVAGAVLLARGKRKAGFAATAAGAAIALLENPEEVSTAWENIPSYIQHGKRLLGRLEGFVEDLSGQGGRFKSLLERLDRR
jgi:hypothetical protein